MLKNHASIIRAWAFYDWANSAYILIITSVLFPLFYQDLAEKYADKKVPFFNWHLNSDVLYSYVIAFIYLLITLISPWFSSIADLRHYKKTFLAFFCFLGVLGSISLYWFNIDNLELSFISVAFASIGFWISLIFYNAYLPEIAEKSSIYRISAYGYTLGYVGSSLLLIFFLFALKFNWLDVRQCFIVVGLWWLVFSLYPLNKLPGKVQFFSLGILFTEGKRSYFLFKKVFFNYVLNRNIRFFWLAYFFLSLGMQTIIILGTFFAVQEIDWQHQDVKQTLIVLILIIQGIAALGAYIFAYLGEKLGNKKALMIAAAMWVGLCGIAYFASLPQHFYLICVWEGLILGGTQSLARSSYTHFIADAWEQNTLFSLYGIIEKMGIVAGTFLFGFIHNLSHSMRHSVLMLMASFVLAWGFIMCLPGAKNSH